jgi:hypothetical protein
MPTDRTLGRTRQLRQLITGIASGVALTAALPAISAQDYELVPPSTDAAAQRGITVRAQVDVLFTPPGASAPILVQKAFETRASAINLSSQYVFDILNDAALAGVDQALAGGAQTGRFSVVAVCYSYGMDNNGSSLVAPMGVFINTTDMAVTADGHAALKTNVKVIPPIAPGR